MYHLKEISETIRVAMTQKEAPILLKNANVVNVFSGEIIKTNVAIADERIAGIGDFYEKGKKVIDVAGKYILPGLIDAHVHLESSMVAPSEFAKAVLSHGTTTVIIDPHEIANVSGIAGIEYILKATEDLPLCVFVTASSCVPATDMESAGAVLSHEELEELLSKERVVALAEMMNFPGVFLGVTPVLKKLEAAHNAQKPIDGHAPGLSGKELNAYASSGVRSDHECMTEEEALEKLRLGMHIFIREGSAAKNLDALIGLVNDRNYFMCSFCTDDRHPDDLLSEGHLDQILRKAVAKGMDPVRAIQMTTINTATYFNLKNYGAIAPGYFANLIVVDDLKEFKTSLLISNGEIIIENGKFLEDMPLYIEESIMDTMNVKPLTTKDLAIQAKGEKARIIELIPDQIVTRKTTESPAVNDGFVVSDTERDILKLAVVERHNETGNIGLGLVRGFGLKQGAIASSVAHDSHNLIVVGANDDDMLLAANRTIEIGGGFVVVGQGKVLGEVALPIAGLMSDQSLEEVTEGLTDIHSVSKEIGSVIDNPFMTLAFISLPVIPELKLTDKGLVDVLQFKIVDLFE
jgi:adenine deaminase